MVKLKHTKPNPDEKAQLAVHTEAVPRVLDGGYGWVICLAGFVVQFVILGIHNSFGILYTFLMTDMKSAASDTAWIGSIAFGMNFLCGPLVSGLSQRFGCRIVGVVGGLIGALGLLVTSFANNIYIIYVTYSLMWGFGSALNYAPTMIILGEYFRKHLALANGIVTAGSGIGTLAMGPLFQLLLSTLGWRVMIRIISAISLLLFIVPVLYRPVPAARKQEGPRKRVKFIELSVWKNKAFIFWVISMSMLFVGYFVPFIHLPNHAISMGISSQLASLLIGYLSIASTVSRVLFGLFLNHPRVNRFYVLQVCFLMMAVTTTLCPLAKTYEGLILYAVGFGCFDGCFVLLIAVSTSDIVGPDKLAPALGNLFGIIAIPMIFGPPVAGFIYQVSGSYRNAFFVAGGAIALGTCTLSLIPLCMKGPQAQEVQPDDVSMTSSDDSACKKHSLNDSRYDNDQSSFRYDTQRFSMDESTWSLSSYAIGRLGDVFGVLEAMDRESDV